MRKDTNIRSRMLFTIFGWRVYISNKPMKARERHPRLRRMVKKRNLELAGHKCQCCGKALCEDLYYYKGIPLTDLHQLQNIHYALTENEIEIEI